MRVLAVDPGLTCGAALWEDGALLHHGQAGYSPMLDWAEVAIPALDVVVCEDFRIGPATMKAGADWRHPTAAMGVLRYWADRAGVEFVLQSAASGKSFGTDDKLRAMGWYRPTSGGHANDAARHLLTYLTGKGLVDLAVLGKILEDGESLDKPSRSL